jgi:hypothetical protein
MMVMTETNFSEFVMFINTHPKWRHKLVRALFPDLDIAKTFRGLVESQRQTYLTLQKFEQDFAEAAKERAELKEGLVEAAKERAELKEGLVEAARERTRIEDKVDKGFAEAATDRTEIKRDVAEIKRDMANVKHDMANVKHDMANVKGINYEGRVVQQADAIFGLFIRRGHNARNEIGPLLEEAEDNGIISEQEHEHVYALDLLWAGKQKETKADIVLAIEVSWRAEETDIERAVDRAETLRKIGLTALPVVAGVEWDEAITNLAHQYKVVVVVEKKVDKSSWYNAN